MILDLLENAALYEGLCDNIAAGLEHLRTNDYRDAAPGNYPIEGTDHVVIVQEFTTRPHEETKWETHNANIDIQYVISGAERVGCTPSAGLQETIPYDAGKDCTFYEGDGNYFEFKEGMCAVFFPTDAHRCCGILDTPKPVKKICVKIRI